MPYRPPETSDSNETALGSTPSLTTGRRTSPRLSSALAGSILLNDKVLQNSPGGSGSHDESKISLEITPQVTKADCCKEAITEKEVCVLELFTPWGLRFPKSVCFWCFVKTEVLMMERNVLMRKVSLGCCKSELEARDAAAPLWQSRHCWDTRWCQGNEPCSKYGSPAIHVSDWGRGTKIPFPSSLDQHSGPVLQSWKTCHYNEHFPWQSRLYLD